MLMASSWQWRRHSEEHTASNFNMAASNIESVTDVPADVTCEQTDCPVPHSSPTSNRPAPVLFLPLWSCLCRCCVDLKKSPENGGSMFIRNVGVHTDFQLRRWTSRYFSEVWTKWVQLFSIIKIFYCYFLFVYNLLNHVFSGSDNTESNESVISKWWIGKDAEGRGLSLIWGTITSLVQGQLFVTPQSSEVMPLLPVDSFAYARRIKALKIYSLLYFYKFRVQQNEVQKFWNLTRQDEHEHRNTVHY
jgi:hypothetical protein